MHPILAPTLLKDPKNTFDFGEVKLALDQAIAEERALYHLRRADIQHVEKTLLKQALNDDEKRRAKEECAAAIYLARRTYSREKEWLRERARIDRKQVKINLAKRDREKSAFTRSEVPLDSASA